jgi:DNA sulfur modification protein DndB
MLNPTDGHIIAGAVLDEHRFMGRMRGAQLLQVAVDPRRTEDLKQVTANADLEAVRRIRMEVQRLFEGAKAKNVEPYANYIVALKAGQPGMTPPIILFTEHSLKFEETDDGTSRVLVPWGTQLVAIDGETQLAARFEAANIDGNTKQEFVPVLICHGHTLDWARQVFHDLNLLGVRPNAAIGISMDARDPLTYVARQVEHRVPFFSNRVNTVRRQLRRSDSHVVTITALRGACVTLAEGIGGVKYGARPVHVDSSKVEHVCTVAAEWFTSVANAIGPAIEDRERTLASAPAVLAAIGAIGHELVQITDAKQRAARREELLDRLRLVKWDKSKAWEGIAGKFSPSGRFSVGGSKETAYAVYAALTDRSSEGYNRIRNAAA